MTDTLVDVLRPRAQAILDVVVPRVYDDDGKSYPFQDWGKGTGRLRSVGKIGSGYLRTPNSVRYEPEGANTNLFYCELWDIAVTEMDDDGGRADPSANSVNVENATYTYSTGESSVEVDLGLSFSRTTSREESWQRAWKLGASLEFKRKFGAVDVGAKVEAEYGQTLTDRTSESTTTTNTYTSKVVLPKNAKGALNVTRSVRNVADIVTTRGHFDFQFKLGSDADGLTESVERLLGGWSDVLYPAIMGLAPKDQAASGPPWNVKGLWPNFWYEFTYGMPVAPDVRAALGEPINSLTTYQVPYHAIAAYDIKER